MHLNPWLSSADIDKGSRWATDVAAKLETSKIGIICVTPGNLHSDWILFEAGALSKTLQNTFVWPLLLAIIQERNVLNITPDSEPSAGA